MKTIQLLRCKQKILDEENRAERMVERSAEFAAMRLTPPDEIFE